MNSRSSSEAGVRLRDRQRSETRAAILAAAEAVFAEDGIGEARMESIAARAGVAVGTLYNYFEDRQSLLASLVGERRAELLRKLDAAIAAGRGRPFEEALLALLRTLFSHWTDHRALLRVVLQADGAGLAAGRGHILDEVTRRTETVLRRGRAAGALRLDPAGIQATLLVGMVRNVLRRDVDVRPGRGVPDRAAQVLEAFVHGSGA